MTADRFIANHIGKNCLSLFFMLKEALKKKHLRRIIAFQLVTAVVLVAGIVAQFSFSNKQISQTIQHAAESYADVQMKNVVNNVISQIEVIKNDETNTARTGIIYLAHYLSELPESRIVSFIKNNAEHLFVPNGVKVSLLLKDTGGSVLFRNTVFSPDSPNALYPTSVTIGEYHITLFTSHDDVDSVVKRTISKELHNTLYGTNEYIWVNEVVNYEGGDNYAIRRIHPNLISTEGQYLSTNIQDAAGNYPYLSELEGIKKDGELYQNYYFKNLADDKIALKYSYAKLYKPYNWIIATGIPLAELYSFSTAEEQYANTINRIFMAVSFVVILLILGSSIALIKKEIQLAVAGKDIERYRELLRNIPAGCGIIHFKDDFFYVDVLSEGCLRIPYISKEIIEQCMGIDFLTAVYKADRQAIIDEYDRVKDLPDETGSTNFRILGNDTELHWLNFKFRRAYIRDGIQYYYAIFNDIDRQKYIEQEVIKTKQMYDDAAKEARLVVWTYDIEKHQSVMMTEGYTGEICKQLGIPEIIDNVPESIVKFVDERDRDIFLDIYRKIDAGAPIAKGEFRFQMPGQETQQYERMTFRRITDKDGNLLTVHCCGQNITNQKNALEKYRNYFVQLINSNPHSNVCFQLNITRNSCISMTAKDASFEPLKRFMDKGTVDGIFEETAASVPDTEIRKKILELFNQKNLLKIFDEGESSLTIEYPCISVKSGIRWQRGTVHMARNPENGDIEGITFSVNIDAEIDLENLTKALSRGVCGFLIVLDMNSGRIRFGGEISDNSSSQYRDVDYTSAMIEALKTMVSPEILDEAIHAHSIENIRDRLEIAPEYTVDFETIDGRWLHWRISYIDRDRGQVIILRSDITAAMEKERQQKDALQAALNSAEKANEAKSTFLSSVSHDLRTPLNGVIGFTDMAIQESDPKKTKDYLLKIKAAGDLLKDLVNDTLELSRIESGKIAINREAVMPNALFPCIVTALRPSAESKRITLVTDFQYSEDVPFFCDKLKVQKIVLNLISNAIKYTPEGGTISFTVKPLDSIPDCYLLVIEDNGIGMSEAFLKQMYEPFAQEQRSESANVTGTGLGLAIVKRYVDLMDGSISVKSKIHEGTCFTVSLPLPEAERNLVQKVENECGVISLAGRRVLLCEDNAMNLEIATTLLRNKGLTVETATNGKEGVEKFLASPEGYYNAILMDIRMPIMNGMEATRQIRSLNRVDARTIPIIAMSADAFEESILAAREAGMDAYTTKPIKPEKFYSVLQEHIQGVKA